MSVMKTGSEVSPPSPGIAETAAVAESFLQAVRLHLRLKAQAQADPERGLERAAVALVGCLAADGPMRASALAESAQSDPSTVSRQVASLVARGLIERGHDPRDGRATVLGVTGRGRAVLEESERARNEFYRQVLTGWDDDEARQFAAQLSRLVDGLERNRPDFSRGSASAHGNSEQAAGTSVEPRPAVAAR
jgi:DNA-binding MarR family transcriptional regulator